jgi:putative phage-type endonuclease
MEQRSDDWYKIRCGKLTASRISDATAKLKSGGWGASRDRYLTEVVIERLTGQVAQMNFVSADMQWGIDTEPEARASYEFRTGSEVMEVGFVDIEDIMMGCSPDGLVGDDGCVEFKCPASHTHLSYLLKKKIPGNYAMQMQMQMLVCDRAWCDFVSYDPRMPPHLQMWIQRLPRLPDELMNELRDDCVTFLNDVDKTVADLEKDYG